MMHMGTVIAALKSINDSRKVTFYSFAFVVLLFMIVVLLLFIVLIEFVDVGGAAGDVFLQAVPLCHRLARILQHLLPVIASSSQVVQSDGAAAHQLVATNPAATDKIMEETYENLAQKRRLCDVNRITSRP